MKIGLKLPLFPSAALGRGFNYLELRELAQRFEAAGFDSLWLMDHLLARPDGEATVGYWEAGALLPALAEATDRIEIGTLVLCAPFRNPVVLAKMAMTIDEISSGRFVLGLGAGWHKPEFDAAGLPFDHRVGRFEEALKIIQPLLKQGQVEFEGQYHRALRSEIAPVGPRPQGPPILIGGSGPRMLRLTAQFADMWNITGISEPEELAALTGRLDAACQAFGRDPASLAKTLQIRIAFPEIAPPPAWMTSFLSGNRSEIAAAIESYEALGFSDLIFQMGAEGMAAMPTLAEAVRDYRG